MEPHRLLLPCTFQSGDIGIPGKLQHFDRLNQSEIFSCRDIYYQVNCIAFYKVDNVRLSSPILVPFYINSIEPEPPAGGINFKTHRCYHFCQNIILRRMLFLTLIKPFLIWEDCCRQLPEIWQCDESESSPITSSGFHLRPRICLLRNFLNGRTDFLRQSNDISLDSFIKVTHPAGHNLCGNFWPGGTNCLLTNGTVLRLAVNFQNKESIFYCELDIAVPQP